MAVRRGLLGYEAPEAVALALVLLLASLETLQITIVDRLFLVAVLVVVASWLSPLVAP